MSVRISELPSTTNVLSTSYVAVVQAGVTNKVQVQDILAPLSYNFPATGRLSLSSSAPIVTGTSSNIYYYPFTGSTIALKSASSWYLRSFTSNGTAIPTVSGGTVANLPYDVYAYWTGSAVALELTAWTSDSARSTPIIFDAATGILVKSGDSTRRFLGTVRTNAANQFCNTLAQRYIWNYYNRLPQVLEYHYTGGQYNLGGQSGYRNVGGDTNAFISFINGDPWPTQLEISAHGTQYGSTGANFVEYSLRIYDGTSYTSAIGCAFMTGIGAPVYANVSLNKSVTANSGLYTAVLQEAEFTISGWYSTSMADPAYTPIMTATIEC